MRGVAFTWSSHPPIFGVNSKFVACCAIDRYCHRSGGNSNSVVVIATGYPVAIATATYIYIYIYIYRQSTTSVGRAALAPITTSWKVKVRASDLLWLTAKLKTARWKLNKQNRAMEASASPTVSCLQLHATHVHWSTCTNRSSYLLCALCLIFAWSLLIWRLYAFLSKILLPHAHTISLILQMYSCHDSAMHASDVHACLGKIKDTFIYLVPPLQVSWCSLIVGTTTWIYSTLTFYYALFREIAECVTYSAKITCIYRYCHRSEWVCHQTGVDVILKIIK